MKYSFNEQLQRDEKEFGRNSNSMYFDLEEGNNNIARVLTPGAVYGNHFLGKGVRSPVCYGKEKGCPIKDKEGKFHAATSPRYVLFVLDRKSNEIKVAFFPYTVMKQIGVLQSNPDYAFDGLPMPYDIRITSNPSGSPAEKYKVDVKPNSANLTEEQLRELDKKYADKSPEQIVARMKEKQMEADKDSGKWLSPDKLAAEQRVRDEQWDNTVKTHIEDTQNNPVPVIKYPEEDIKAEDIPF